MNNNIIKYATIATLAAVSFTACKKDKVATPTPVEQELITTVKLVVSDGAGFNKTFVYKVENGFGSTSQGTVTKDSVLLAPNKTYNVEVQLLNEKTSPTTDETVEVKNENTEHLFLYQSSPATGAGSVAFSDGSKDDKGNAFNQTGKFKTDATGNGTLTVTLKHQPTNKAATTPDAAGGETDVEAVFNVKLQ